MNVRDVYSDKRITLFCSNPGSILIISVVGKHRTIYIIRRYLGLNRQLSTPCTMMLIIRVNDYSVMYCFYFPITSTQRETTHTHTHTHLVHSRTYPIFTAASGV